MWNAVNIKDRIGAGLGMIYEGLKLPPATADTARMAEAAGALLGSVEGDGPPFALPTPASQAMVTLLDLTDQTTTNNSADQTNTTARGVVIIVSLTAFATAADLTVKVQLKNADGTYTDLTSGVQLTAVGKVAYVIDPLVGAAAAGVFDETLSKHLPHEWRVVATHGNANNHTYKVIAYPIR